MNVFEIFRIELLKPASVLQANMMAAGIYSRNGEKEKALELLEHYVDLYQSCDDTGRLGGDDFFDEVEHWLRERKLDSGLMRDQRLVQKDAVAGMLEEPDFEPLRDNPQFLDMLRRLETARNKE